MIQLRKEKLIHSLTEENLANPRCIDHPKTINYQKGKCVKVQFLGENENRVPSVFTRYLKLYFKVEIIFLMIYQPLKHK